MYALVVVRIVFCHKHMLPADVASTAGAGVRRCRLRVRCMRWVFYFPWAP